jgi:hypothetical protein
MTREELIEIGKRVASQLGPKATRADFKRITGISIGHIYKRFEGGWSEFRNLIGLGEHPDRPRGPVSDDDLLQSLHSIALSVGRFPKRYEIDRSGLITTSTVQQRLGSLRRGARERYRAWLETNEPNSPLLSLLPSPTERQSRDNEMASEVSRSNSRLSPMWERRDGQVYGAPINFRGLRHAPINEQGVVFLFGMVADDLGFLVEAVQGGFPDCEAKRCVDSKRNRWQRVRIEFEFCSSNFREHGHDSTDCDMIVCWEHDWPGCPLEVIELRSVIDQLEG